MEIRNMRIKVFEHVLDLLKITRKPFVNRNLNEIYEGLFCENEKKFVTKISCQRRSTFLNLKMTIGDLNKEQLENVLRINESRALLFSLKSKPKIEKTYVLGVIIQRSNGTDLEVLAFFKDSSFVSITTEESFVEGKITDMSYVKDIDDVLELCELEIMNENCRKIQGIQIPNVHSTKVVILTSKGNFTFERKNEDFKSDSLGLKLASLLEGFNSLRQDFFNNELCYY